MQRLQHLLTCLPIPVLATLRRSCPVSEDIRFWQRAVLRSEFRALCLLNRSLSPSSAPPLRSLQIQLRDSLSKRKVEVEHLLEDQANAHKGRSPDSISPRPQLVYQAPGGNPPV